MRRISRVARQIGGLLVFGVAVPVEVDVLFDELFVVVVVVAAVM